MENAEDVVVVSSDAIREELFGDASIQENHGLVFNIAHKRILEALKHGKTAILDATNTTAKNRRQAINPIINTKNLEVEMECHVVLSTPEQSIRNQQQRERKTPEEALYRHLKQFTIPSFEEGFQKIVFYNPFYDEHLLQRLTEQMDDVMQTGKWHLEDLGVHTRMVTENIQQLSDAPHLKEAAMYHDIGKIYTAFEDNGQMRFFSHPQASTYLYLTGTIQDTYTATLKDMHDVTSPYYIATLIAHHDDGYRSDFDKEKWTQKYGVDIVKDLTLLREADMKGSIRREETKQMELLQFINQYKDWEQILSKEPFVIKISRDGEYVLFKYNQFGSDMNYRLVKQSRGSIFKQDETGKFQYVCRPFEKFFNYGEEQASVINWKEARVTEKVDGSLMKMFYDNGEWHLATNGTINAFHAPVVTGDDEIGKTFGEIFERALGEDIHSFGKQLDKNYTYLFELTSPETEVVIPYPDGIYYLSRIETQTGKEDFNKQLFYDSKAYENQNGDVSHLPFHSHIQYPAIFHLSRLDDVLSVTRQMTKDEEGVVVNDLHGNRIKVKSPEYLQVAHLEHNGYVSDKRLIEYMQEEKLDDLLAYRPKYTEKVQALQETIHQIANEWEKDWTRMPTTGDKKEFALKAKELSSRSYLFERYKHPHLPATEYLLNLRSDSLYTLIEQKRKEMREIGVDEKEIEKTEKAENDFSH